MTSLRSPKMRLESFTIIYKEKEALEEGNMVEKIIFLEEEEEVDEEK